MQVEFFVGSTAIGLDTDGSDGWLATWDLTGVDDGDYTITATAVDTIGQSSGSDSVTVTVDLVPDPLLHVGDLDGSSAWEKKQVKWVATLIITVHTSDETLFEGATVSGTWRDGEAGSCVTDVEGVCTIELTGISKRSASVSFFVEDISYTGYGYDDSTEYPSSITVYIPQ